MLHGCSVLLNNLTGTSRVLHGRFQECTVCVASRVIKDANRMQFQYSKDGSVFQDTSRAHNNALRDILKRCSSSSWDCYSNNFTPSIKSQQSARIIAEVIFTRQALVLKLTCLWSVCGLWSVVCLWILDNNALRVFNVCFRDALMPQGCHEEEALLQLQKCIKDTFRMQFHMIVRFRSFRVLTKALFF